MARPRVSRSKRRTGLLLALSGSLAGCGAAPAPVEVAADAKAGPPAAAGDLTAPDPKTSPEGPDSPVPKVSPDGPGAPDPKASPDGPGPHDPTASRPVPPDSPASPDPKASEPVSSASPLAPQTLVATGPGGPLTLHLAAVREGDITLHALADGSLAARGDVAFALAAPGAGSLRRESAWLRDLPEGDWMPIETATVFGGRFPDAAFFSFSVEYDRSGGGHMAYRWQTDRWKEIELESATPGFDGLYAAYVGGPGGAVLGLRSDALGSSSDDVPPAELRAMKAALGRMRPAIERLDRAEPGPWPELPAGPAALDMLGFADGSLVVMRGGPKLQRWTPGAKSWKTLPPLGYKATGYYDSATLVGRDPARIYVHSCADTAAREPRLHRLADDTWQEIVTPDGKCVWSLTEAADGALWVITIDHLYRHPAPGPAAGPTASPDWQTFTLPGVQLPARPRTWRHNADVFAWMEIAARPALEQPLMPSRVLALGPGDVWINATAGDSDIGSGKYREVLLTTRTIDAPIWLPDDGRIAIEMSGLGEAKFGLDCYTPVLELGVVTAAPATARPPALVDPALDGLAVVTGEVDGGHDIAVLRMTAISQPEETTTKLAALAERLRPSFPQLRLACRLPRVVDVLP